MRRAMLVLQGQSPQESTTSGYPFPYDHPYFGQIFLAVMLKIIGYPSSLILSPSSLFFCQWYTSPLNSDALSCSTSLDGYTCCD